MNLRGILRQRGQGLVEFAVIFPLFALLIFAVDRRRVADGALQPDEPRGDGGRAPGAVQQRERALRPTRSPRSCGGRRRPRGRRRRRLRAQLPNFERRRTGRRRVRAVARGSERRGAGRDRLSIRVAVKYKYNLITPLVNQISGLEHQGVHGGAAGAADQEPLGSADRQRRQLRRRGRHSRGRRPSRYRRTHRSRRTRRCRRTRRHPPPTNTPKPPTATNTPNADATRPPRRPRRRGRPTPNATATERARRTATAEAHRTADLGGGNSDSGAPVPSRCCIIFALVAGVPIGEHCTSTTWAGKTRRAGAGAGAVRGDLHRDPGDGGVRAGPGAGVREARAVAEQRGHGEPGGRVRMRGLVVGGRPVSNACGSDAEDAATENASANDVAAADVTPDGDNECPGEGSNDFPSMTVEVDKTSPSLFSKFLASATSRRSRRPSHAWAQCRRCGMAATTRCCRRG